VVLAFDADAAGQGAAERFYEWENRYKVQVSVAQFPVGKDPGDLASSDPEALIAAVTGAQPFLGFRLQRVLNSGSIATPEDRSRTAQRAMAVINEHPDRNVRKLYAGQVASHVGIPAADLVAVAERGSRRPEVQVVSAAAAGHKENGEFVAIALMIQLWDEIAPWLVEELFSDDVFRRAFLSLAQTQGNLIAALAAADPEAREVLERAAVADVEVRPIVEAWNLVAAAVRRELLQRVRISDPDEIRRDRDARVLLEQLEVPTAADAAATQLLEWLVVRAGDHT
jgi:DNA primase